MYWALKFLLFTLSRLPLNIVQALGRMLGGMAWILLRERRRIAIINAGIIGAAHPVQTARQSFNHTFMAYMETAYIRCINEKFLQTKITAIEGKEHYDKIAAEGQKYMFISAHIGSWDLSAPVVSMSFGFKALIVGRENNSEAINRLLDDERNRGGSIAYVRQQGYLETLAKYEKEGYVSGSLLDHSTTKSDSVIAPFFGLRVPTLAGLAALCARKKMVMLPGYLIRDGNGFRIIMHRPIHPDVNLKPRERILDLVTRMNAEYETIIKQYPEQWYLLHKRFKKVEEPDGTISHRIYRP